MEYFWKLFFKDKLVLRAKIFCVIGLKIQEKKYTFPQ